MSYFSEKKEIHIPITRVRVKESSFFDAMIDRHFALYKVQYKKSNSFFALWHTYGKYTTEGEARIQADHIIKCGELIKQEYVTNEMYFDKK